jgi:hypothetical protein
MRQQSVTQASGSVTGQCNARFYCIGIRCYRAESSGEWSMRRRKRDKQRGSSVSGSRARIAADRSGDFNTAVSQSNSRAQSSSCSW